MKWIVGGSKKRAAIVAWLIDYCTGISRIVAWIGISAIIVMSVVPLSTALLQVLGSRSNTLQPLREWVALSPPGVAFH
jgi:hypothetical protein